MNWINASNKLPPMEKAVFLKIDGETMGMGNFYQQDQCYMLYVQRNGAHDEYEKPWHSKMNVQWLDEATPPATVINFDLREVQQWINNELIKLGGQHKHGAKEDDEYYLGKWAAFDEVRIYLSNSPAKNIQPLQWVKASERKPNIISKEIRQSKRLHLKTFGTYAQIGIYYSDNNEFELWDTDGKKTTFNHASFHLIEWLDESTPPNQLSGIDVVDQLKAWAEIVGIVQGDHGEVAFMETAKELLKKYGPIKDGPTPTNQPKEISDELSGREEMAKKYADSIVPNPNANDAPYYTTGDKWDDINEAFKAGYAASEGEEAIGDDALLNISRFAVENKYKSPMAGNETAIWMVDIPKVINYIKENYKLSKK